MSEAAAGGGEGDELRAVLVDAMGVLLHMRPPARLLRAELRERFGWEVSEVQAAAALHTEIRYYRAHHLEGRDEASLADLRRRCARMLAMTLPHGASGVPEEELAEALLASLRFQALPGVLDALAALRARGLRLVVVSDWDCSLTGVLETLELLPLLDGVVTSSTLGVAKPDVRVFAAGLELAGASAAQAVHVGDRFELDVVGARAAGVRSVLVAPGGWHGDGDVEVIGGLRELPALLFDAG